MSSLNVVRILRTPERFTILKDNVFCVSHDGVSCLEFTAAQDAYDYMDVINRSIESPVTYARWCVDNKILCASTEPVARPARSLQQQTRSAQQSITHCAVNSDALGRYNSTMIDIKSSITAMNTMLSAFNAQDIKLNTALLKARSDVDNLVARVNSMPASITTTCCGDTSTASSKRDNTCCALNQSNSFICVCGVINNQLTKPYLDGNGVPQCNPLYGCMYEPYSTGYGNVVNGVLSCKCTSNAVWNPTTKKCEPLPSRACPSDASKVVNSIGLSPTNSIQVSQDNSKCVDLREGSTADRTPFQIYDCNNTNAQHFRYNRDTKQIIHTNSGKCLDVRNNVDAVDNPLHLFPCDTTRTNQAQRFTLDNTKGHIIWDGSATGRRVGVSTSTVTGVSFSDSLFRNDQALVLMNPSSSNRQIFDLSSISPPCVRCETNRDCPAGNMCVQLFGVTTCVPQRTVDVTGTTNSSAWIEIITPTISGRYILVKRDHERRLTTNVTSNAEENVLNIAEIRVFDTSNVNVVSSSTSTATSSNTDPRFGPSNVIDNNTNTFTHTSAGDLWSDHWIKVDLGRVHNIRRVELENRQDCCRNRLAGTSISIYDGAGVEIFKSTPFTERESSSSVVSRPVSFSATLTRSHISEGWYQSLPNVHLMSNIYLRVRPVLVVNLSISSVTLFGTSSIIVSNVLLRRNGNMLKVMESLGDTFPLIPPLTIPRFFVIPNSVYNALPSSVRDPLNLNTSIINVEKANDDFFDPDKWRITRNINHYVPISLSTDRIQAFNELESTPRFTTTDQNDIEFTYMTNEWCPLMAGFMNEMTTWYSFIKRLAVYEIEKVKFPLELELVLMSTNTWQVRGRMSIIVCNTFDVEEFLFDMNVAGGGIRISKSRTNVYTVPLPYNKVFDVYNRDSTRTSEHMILYARATDKFTSTGNSGDCFTKGSFMRSFPYEGDIAWNPM